MVETNLVSLAIETYQRLLPELNHKLARNSNPDQSNEWSLAPVVQLPTVKQLLGSIEPAPYHSILIGSCEDGLPFLLDLAQPAAGPLLVVGDRDCGKTRQMKVMAESALCLASPREIQIGVVTDEPGNWSALFIPSQRSRHKLGVFTWADPETARLIESLAGLAEARLSGKRNGTAVLFFVENLARIQDLDYRVQMAFHWLLENGSQCGIWVITSLQANEAVDLPFWVNIFHTRLFGKIETPEIAEQLSVFGGLDSVPLLPGAEFCTWLGKEWMPYWVPVLGE